MSVDIQIAPGSATPIYWQIKEHITRAVATGQLTPGEQLPSVRSLAERLLVNPNTVAKAYNDLLHDGVIESRRGKGLYVLERRSALNDEERAKRLATAIDIFLHDIRLLDYSRDAIIDALIDRWPAPVPLLEERVDDK